MTAPAPRAISAHLLLLSMTLGTALNLPAAQARPVFDEPPASGCMEGPMPDMPPAAHRPPPFEHLLDDLDLSDEQYARIQRTLRDQRLAMREHERTVRETRQAMHELMRAESLDEARLDSLGRTLGDSLSALHTGPIRTRHAILALLSEAQRDAVRERMTRQLSMSKRNPHLRAQPRAVNTPETHP
ncbi:MAG: periplasmic heavy metal sensor [Pseudomonadota bacterium]